MGSECRVSLPIVAACAGPGTRSTAVVTMNFIKTVSNKSKGGGGGGVAFSHTATAQSRLRASEVMRRPSAICGVLTNQQDPSQPAPTAPRRNSNRRESNASTATVESTEFIDPAQLIDNEQAKAFAGGNKKEAKATATGLSRFYFSSAASETRDRGSMGKSCTDNSGPDGTTTVCTDISASIQLESSASKGADLMKTIFGNSNHKDLKSHHHRLPSVLMQIFASQQDEVTRRISGLGDLHDDPTSFQYYVYNVRHSCHRLMASPKSQAFFIVLTLYALYGPDLVSFLARKDNDEAFLIINTIIFACFAIEIVILSIANKLYLCSVPALLDIIAFVSFSSDTYVMQGGFMGQDTERTTRLARSTRMTRMVRVARVARVTKLVPRLIEFFGGHSHNLARQTLIRRLWRLFLFMDADHQGCLSIFDFKVIYLVIIQECPFLLFDADKVTILQRDAATFTQDPRLKDEESVFEFSDFTRIMLNLALGQHLLHYHIEEVEKDNAGVWTLTRKVTDRIALKICIGILIIFGILQLLDTAEANQSMLQGLGVLDDVIGKEIKKMLPDLAFICEQIRCYMDDHKVMMLFVAGSMYIKTSGAQCSTGIPKSATMDPWRILDDILDETHKRATEVLLICWPEETTSCYKDRDRVTSLALLDTEDGTRTLAMWSVIQTSVILVLIVIFILGFNRGVSRFSKTLLMPLRALVDDMQAMCSLDLVEIDADTVDGGRPVKVVSKKNQWFKARTSSQVQVGPSGEAADEMRHLQHAFGSMRNAVRSWTKYVPPAVVQRLMTSGFEATIGVSRVSASILFVDIDGFEEVCRGFAPQETLALLSSVLGKVADAIAENKGILLEFIGDEVLAVFNVPTALVHHTYHATKCSVQIHEAVEKMPPTIVQDGRHIAVRCRCGVHTAQILAGNVGSKKRMKFGLLGDGVNLTARLKTLNSRYRTQTIVSDKVIDATLIDSRFVWRPLEKVAVKGRKESTTVFEVLGMKSDSSTNEFERLADLHIDAFDLYHKRQFAEARKLCEEVHSLFEVVGRQDEPSRQLLKKCLLYSQQPPPPEWDGVERLQKKTFDVQNEDESEQRLNELAKVCTEAFTEGIAKEATAASVVLSMPSRLILPPPEFQTQDLVVARQVGMDVPSCWRHLIQLPGARGPPQAQGEVSMARPAVPGASSFCGCGAVYPAQQTHGSSSSSSPETVGSGSSNEKALYEESEGGIVRRVALL